MSNLKLNSGIPLTPTPKSPNTLIWAATIASAAAVILGLLSLLGWGLNILVLASFIPDAKPTAPSAAVILILLGIILFGQVRYNWSESTRKLLHALSLLVSLFCFCEVVFGITNVSRSIDWWVLRNLTLISTPAARISPIDALLAFLIGSMTALLLSATRQSKPKKWLRDLPGLIATLAMCISGSFLLGYIYGAPFLYNSRLIPISAPASLAFLLLSISVIMASGSGSAPIRWFIGPKTKARLMQVFIPLVITATIGTDLLQHIISRALHASNALVMSVASLLLALLVAGIASLVSRQIGRRIDEAEAALQASTERWKVTLHSIGDAVIATDAKRNITVMNSVAETLTGWSEAEAIGHPISEVFHIINEATRETCDDPIEKVLRLGTVVGLANHTVLIARDGKEYCIADSGSPIRDETGSITGVILVFRDVTEERRAQDDLNASNDRFRQAIVNAPIPIMLHAEDGEILQISSTWTHLTGYEISDIPTIRDWVARAHGDKYDTVIATIHALFQLNQRSHGLQYEITTLSGDRRNWRFHSGPLGCLPDGRKLVITMAMDVTERCKAELRQAFALKILLLLNTPSPDQSLTEKLLESLQEYTGCDAIALRLQDGSDYPYHIARGFSDTFISEERSLCEYDPNGEILLDENRKPCLQCMCANVILGRTDPTLPFFTKGGSFWTNNNSKLMADKSNIEWTKNLRNRCNKEGYESLALVALRSGPKTLGLIQLADRKANHFTPELIQFFEEVGASIGIALARNRSESTLRESEERFRILFERTPSGYQSLDADGRFLDVNQAWLDLLGYERDEIIGHWFGDFLVPHQTKLFKQRFPLFKETGVAHDTDFEMVCKDGSVVSVVFEGRIGHDSFGQFKQTHCVLHNITERKQSEEMVKHERDQARLYLDIAAVMITALDRDGNITLINRQGCEILNYKEDELIGKNWVRFLVPSECQGQVSDVLHSLLAGNLEGVDYYESRICTQDGRQRLLAFRNTVIRNTAGDINGILFSGEDITDRRQTEQQLRQAAKMESIGRLAGGVAHDFNNILTGISGLTEFAMHNSVADSPVHQDLSEVLSLTNRAANLTRQLLAFSRHQTIETKPVDLNSLVSNLLKMLKRLIGEDIDLVFCPVPNTGMVFADPGLLEQLLMNLAVNARDAMPNGGRMSIEIRNVVLDDSFQSNHLGLKPGEHVMLTVSDTGCGMDQDTIQHIFEPFFTTKDVGKGTGLGLATVYGIVKQHNGSISVYSEPGIGTTFKVYIPRYGADPYREIGPERNEIPGGSETLLFVEDEMSVREVTQRMLEQHGYTVIATSSASKAIQIFSQYSADIDLLITDVIMPDKSGAELYRELSAKSPILRALFVSGYSGDTLISIMDIAPEVRVLQKPFSREDLLRTVREILDKKTDPVDSE